MPRRESVVWLDPSLHSRNAGDDIISQAVRAELVSLVGSEPPRLPTQLPLSAAQRQAVDDAGIAFVGGTNLLSSNMPMYRQWKLSPRAGHYFRNKAVLLGVGWWQYQSEPNIYTRHVYRNVLSRQLSHAARDQYTADRLSRLGLPTLNTCCVTTWNLPERPEVSAEPGSRVVLTLTDYNKSPDDDRALYNLLTDSYDEVVLWPQGSGDAAYAARLGLSMEVLDEGTASLDAALRVPSTDYVGTRLHAGIRSLQLGCRTVILAVDNRATEMARDVNLPVVGRGDRDGLTRALQRTEQMALRLPHAAISAWRAQMAGRLSV